jgi:hypothetical protein
MEYMVMNEADGSDLLYIMLVEKGYAHPLAFRCLERIKTDFLKFFTNEQFANARYLAFTREFEGAFQRIYVSAHHRRQSIPKTLSTKSESPSMPSATPRLS